MSTSVTDSHGVVYTLDAGGGVLANGVRLGGLTGVVALQLANDVPWAQDANAVWYQPQPWPWAANSQWAYQGLTGPPAATPPVQVPPPGVGFPIVAPIVGGGNGGISNRNALAFQVLQEMARLAAPTNATVDTAFALADYFIAKSAIPPA